VNRQPVLGRPGERAGVISVAYIICYLAMGLPAILAGVLVVHSTVTRTAQEFGITVIALAAITALGTILSARRTARQRCLTPASPMSEGAQHVA
jgi:Na+/melibiose symporter-like transporter